MVHVDATSRVQTMEICLKMCLDNEHHTDTVWAIMEDVRHLQRRVHVNLNSGGLCRCLLDPPLPLLSQTVREHFILLLLSLLESFFGNLSIHGAGEGGTTHTSLPR